jgi:hypothetical protein
MAEDDAKARSSDRASLKRRAEIGDQQVADVIGKYQGSLIDSLRNIDSASMRDAALTEFGTNYTGQSKPKRSRSSGGGGSKTSPVLFGLVLAGVLVLIAAVVSWS